MKKLLFLFILMLSPMLASAEKISDVQNSGCLNETRGEETQRVPTIVLTKEGNILSVQLLNYESNCCTEDFNVAASFGRIYNCDICSVSISPVGDECDCICPFNVSFTVRDSSLGFIPNSFYLDCWWYKGMVELKEGEPLVLEKNKPNQTESLYGEWRLVGWNDGETWFEVNTNYVSHRSMSVEIPKEGYVMAYSMVNEINVGLLTLNGNQMTFGGEGRGLLTEVYCDIMENLFFEHHICEIKSYLLEGKFLKLYYTDNDYFVFTSDFNDNIAYRPFIEEGKVWKVGTISGNPVQVVDYYYFDGDTIIDGKSCKQMMCQRYVSPDYSNEYWTPTSSLSKVGAWYEENKKVYFYDEIRHSMEMKYDFSLNAYDTLQINDEFYVIGPKQMGGIKGFKGVYRDVVMWTPGNSNYSTTWLEGVGGLLGPRINAYNPILSDAMPEFLMSCTVGDEVIYLNDEYEDGATSDVCEARKVRFDFTHTVKTQPKAPAKRGAEHSLYGEYNAQQLDINLSSLEDEYMVHITDASGKVVYEKTINAGNIVGLNIEISSYTKGLYTVTVENNRESFTGEFNANTTGIEEVGSKRSEVSGHYIYNLQGQRISSLRKGLNIVNGQKVYVK